jgi:acyl carrier protein
MTPALDPTEVRSKLRSFICTELLRDPSYHLEDDEPLMTGGLIDSFCIAYLSVFIEMEFRVYIADVDLTVENMDTLRLIGEQVLQGERLA